MICYVNVYHVDRCYGGPEEGGWYYDAGSPWASIPCINDNTKGEIDPTHDVAPETFGVVYSRWRKWCEEENERNPDYTHTNGEGEFRVTIEDHPAKAWPRERVRYE